MNFSIKIGSFNTELGGGIFPTSQENRMLFCSRKSQVRTLPGETAKSEAQEELPQEGCSHFRVAPSVTTMQDSSVTDYVLSFGKN